MNSTTLIAREQVGGPTLKYTSGKGWVGPGSIVKYELPAILQLHHSIKLLQFPHPVNSKNSNL